jgi:hypothetical protein
MDRIAGKWWWDALRLMVACSWLWVSAAAADEHRYHEHEFREHEFHEHAYLDHRYGHDHYYPPHGWAFGALPAHHRVVFFGGVQFYFGDGVWYRFEGPGRYVVIAPPIGIVVPVLPPFYATVWVRGVPYYYANSVYYVRTPYGYEVAAPPPPDVIVEQPPATAPPPGAPPPQTAAAPQSNPGQVFAYPRQGQSEEQAARDRYECHRWAVSQTGYDPTQGVGGANSAADYRRAISACLDARGYTVK